MTDELELDFDLDMDMDIDMEGIPVVNAMDVFYEKKFFFSYSSMKLLLHDPPAFMEKYINKVYEEKLDKHLINGKLIHALILEPDTIGDNFIVSPLAVPTGKNREIIHNTVKRHYTLGSPAGAGFDYYSDFIIEELVRCNLHQALVNDKKDLTLTGDKKRLDKMLTEENCSYFQFMCTRGSKNVVDQPQMDYCVTAAEVIKSNEQLCELMGINKRNSADNTIINEQLYFTDLENYDFGLKGIIDNLNIDHVKKIIYINDFKTTGRKLKDFPEAVTFFDYPVQAVIYQILVGFNFKHLIYDEGYTVEFRFIAIDKSLQAYAFKVSEKTLNNWFTEFNNKLEEANFHYTNKSFDLPYAFATERMIL